MTLNIVVYRPADPDLYIDTADLPDPFSINIPLCITNNESITLYFKAVLVNPPADYTVTEATLGSVGAGSSACFVATFRRYKPSLVDGEYQETVTLRVEAYTDDAYTDLYGYIDIDITIVFIDHTDPAWSVVDIDNFDQGSEEGWAITEKTIDAAFEDTCWILDIKSDHYISSPYSLGCDGEASPPRIIYKDFDLSAYSKAFIVIHIYRVDDFALAIGDQLVIPRAISRLLPSSKWIRLVHKLPTGTTVRVAFHFSLNSGNRLDDIIVIAK